MRKAAAFVFVLVGLLLLVAAETGEEISAANADEKVEADARVPTIPSSTKDNLKQGTRGQEGNLPTKDPNETVIQSESDGTEVEKISTTKAPRRTNNNRRDRKNNGVDERESNRKDATKARKGANKNKKPGKTTPPGGDGPRRSMRIREQKGENNEENNLCAAPPEIDGAMTPRLEGTEHVENTAISYSCNFGYVSRNSINHISVCRFNEILGRAEWTTPNITCIPRSCGDPGYLNNGRRIGNLFTFPNKVEYECDEGYKLRGLRSRYCQAGGDWSGRLPSCEPIYCTAPPDPANGRVKYSSLEYGTELRYECNVGFILKEHEPALPRTCSGEGSWSNEEPECIEARCQAPQSPEHGSVKLHGELKVGSLATYSCDPGKNLIGATTTKCLITGQWTFDAPLCLSTCSVPYIQNGEMGRITTQMTKWGKTKEEFVKIYSGKDVNPNEALFLRCKNGFFPVEDSKFVERNLLEVTCNDGTWTKNLQCHQSSCDGEPPSTRKGSPVISSREHGFTIWYRCNPHNLLKVPGNVTCHFGSWIGIPPKCLDHQPCYTKELNYRGLIKPPQEYLESFQSFEIQCDNGFQRGNSLRKATCNRGKWDITKPPCITDSEAQRLKDFISTTPPGQSSSAREVPHSVYVTPEASYKISDTQRNRKCNCTYDYESNLVTAKVGYKVLRPGDTIMQGELVSLECPSFDSNLFWRNGLRIRGIVNMTCDMCERWQAKDLPTCSVTSRDDTIIGANEDFQVLPGGIIKMLTGDTHRFFCSSPSSQPIWNYNQRTGVSVHDYKSIYHGVVVFVAYLNIVQARDDHSGRYECYVQNNYGHHTGHSVLELRVKEVTCPFHTLGNGLEVSYSMGNKTGSWAAFTCPSNAKLVGNVHALCQHNGTWNSPQPFCDSGDEPCYTKDLNYPGLLKPPQEYLESFQSFEIQCDNGFQRGSSLRKATCNKGKWDITKPPCITASDNLCPQIEGLGIFGVFYDNHRRINSTANFMCNEHGKRVEGCSVVTCLPNRTWSGGYPECVDYASCTRFPHSEWREVRYSNHLSVGSIATFSCSPPKILTGSSVSSCQANGSWSNHPPSCIDNARCDKFPLNPRLGIKYSNNQFAGSIATFTCSASTGTLTSGDISVCQEDGSWSNPLPSCADPQCSIHDLSQSIPETVEPDMSGVNGEFIPFGSEMRLKCNDNSILNGNSKVLCGEDGKWKVENYECVPGCLLNVDPSSHLLVQPVQDSYRFGEFVILSCPPGEVMSNDVERMMCLGGAWTDALPVCKESKQNR